MADAGRLGHRCRVLVTEMSVRPHAAGALGCQSAVVAAMAGLTRPAVLAGRSASGLAT